LKNEKQNLNEVRAIIRELIKEEYIINDILSEGVFNDVLSKVKDYAKKGLMTATILAGLMGSPTFAQMTPQQQDQIKQTAQIEMSDSKEQATQIQEKKVDVDKMSGSQLAQKAGTVEQFTDTIEGKKVTTYVAYGVGEVNDVSYCESLAKQNAQQLIMQKVGKDKLNNAIFIGGKKQYNENSGIYRYYSVYQVSVIQ
jgi:hypothetical protein